MAEVNKEIAAKKFETWSGIPVKRIYTPNDIKEVDYGESLGDAGQYPFTRGKYPNMYRQQLWIARELCGLGTPRETNKRLKFLTSQGQTGLAIVPDQPSQFGLDSDHPMAIPAVGTQGVPICCRHDMEELLDDIDLEVTTSSFSIPGISAIVLVAQYLVAAEKRRYDRKILRGSVQNDPLQAILTCYDLGNSPELLMKLAIDLIEFCAREMPEWHCTTVNAYDLREAGVNAIQEMGFTLAIAIAYIEETLKRGLTIDDFADKMLIISDVHIDFFEEIAKFRAARRVWAKLMRERFHAKNPKSMALTISVHTAGCSLTTAQPFNNITRAAYQALSAILGGCRGLDLSSYDEGICTPSEEGCLVSMQTQHVLTHETGVRNVVDPLGGSYYVEWLTNTLEQKISEAISEIDQMGGMVAAIKSGWAKLQIEKASRRVYEEIEREDKIVVGLNAFQIEPERDNLLPISKSQAKPSAEQTAKIKQMKATRDKAQVEKRLRVLYQVAKERKENLMPYIIEATTADATSGEIVGTIRLAYGSPYDVLEKVDVPFKFD